MEKEVDVFTVFGSEYGFYIIIDENKIYGKYGGLTTDLAKFYGNDLVKELTKIKVDKNELWFEGVEQVKDYLSEVEHEEE